MRTSVALLVALVGCSHPANGPELNRASRTPTCAVLSVGGMQGIAEIGAVIAMRDAGLRPDCIVGNSMGSLVAGLYATSPDENLVDRFRQFRDGYVSRTKDDKLAGGFIAALAIGLLTGGAALPTLGAGLLGADGVANVDRDRVVLTLDDLFGQATIEGLPIPYATFFQQRSDDGLQLIDARSGNLAQSIGRSIANPFVFKNLDVVTEEQLDPGGDRMAAVPVEDACRVFPGRRLIAVNVTGHKAVHTSDMTCPIEEIMVDVGPVNVAGLFSDDMELERVVMIGWRAAARHFGLPALPGPGMAAMSGSRSQQPTARPEALHPVE